MLRKLTPYFFVMPLMLFIAVFTYIPIITSVDLSFRQWDFMSADKPFVGFDNYRVLFRSDAFWNSLWVTTVFAVISVPIRLGLALWFASALTRETFSRRILRGALFLPSVTSTVSIAVVFSWVFATDFGMMNGLLGMVGIDKVRWMQNPDLALGVLIFIN